MEIVLKSFYQGVSFHYTFDEPLAALAEAHSALRNGSSIPIAIYTKDGEVLYDYSSIMKEYKK
jgi:hypothetical protein